MKNKVINAYKKLISNGIEIDSRFDPFSFSVLFVEMFESFPNIYNLNSKYLYGYDKISGIETACNIYKYVDKYPDDYYTIRYNNQLCVFSDNLILDLSYDSDIIVYTNTDISHIDDIPDIIQYNIVFKEKQIDTAKYYYITKSLNGFTSTEFHIKDVKFDIESNYNDNIEHDKIKNFLECEDESGIVIFHGPPGTGKSFYIRYLMNTVKKDFYLLDSNVFNYISDGSFIEFLLLRKNSIFVLEDCETLLMSRDNVINSKLTTLLNLSDGILGDVFNFKFICTFNTELTNIDKALLRKGRLKIKNYFGKLTIDKIKKLNEKLGTKFNTEEKLTNVYNSDDTAYDTPKTKIGFNM